MPRETKRRRIVKGTLPTAALGALASLASLADLADLARARDDAPAQRMPVLFIGHGSPINATKDTTSRVHFRAGGRGFARPGPSWWCRRIG